MSIKSRQRDAKRPNPQCRETHQPGPNLGLIPIKAIGLFRPAYSSSSHNYEPHGKFGGVTRIARFLRELAKKIQFASP